MNRLYLCFANCSIVALGNNISNTFIGFKFPSLLVAILYVAVRISIVLQHSGILND